MPSCPPASAYRVHPDLQATYDALTVGVTVLDIDELFVRDAEGENDEDRDDEVEGDPDRDVELESVADREPLGDGDSVKNTVLVREADTVGEGEGEGLLDTGLCSQNTPAVRVVAGPERLSRPVDSTVA